MKSSLLLFSKYKITHYDQLTPLYYNTDTDADYNYNKPLFNKTKIVTLIFN